MNVYLPNLRLPSAYQEVEYIQSSGTQYIKIGTSFKTSYKVVIDFQMDVIGGDYVPIGINNYDGVNPTYRYGIDAYSSYFHVSAGGNWTSTKSEDTNRHTIIIDKNTAIVDGTSYTIGYSNYTYSSGICVFCYNEYNKSSPYNYKSSNKLYKLDIYDENGNHIYDLVPCYRKSDNVIGLYDLVNNQFYTNSGTGTFSKGNDVTMAELKNAYIGEFVPYTPGENTIARYQFKSDIANHYGNDADWYVYSGSVSYENNMMKYTGELRKNKPTFTGGYSGNFTILSWRKYEGTDSRIDLWRYDFSMNSGMSIPGGNAELCSVYAGGLWYAISLPQMTNGVHLFAMVRSGNTLYGYLDGNLIGSKSISGSLNSTLTCGAMSGAGGTVGETIAENKAWSQTGIQDYYNKTKANYGL